MQTAPKVCRWVYDASDWSFWAGGDNWPRRGGAYPPGVLLRIPPGRARQAKSQPQETTPQNNTRRGICALGDVAITGGDMVGTIGGRVAVGGAAVGAAIGADVGGVGAAPGAIAGATPGLVAMAVGGDVSALGNLTKDLAGGHYRAGAVRFAVNFFGGRVFSKLAETSGVGSLLSAKTKKFLTDAYAEATSTIAGETFSLDSPVNCSDIK